MELVILLQEVSLLSAGITDVYDQAGWLQDF
jgi:hypothetical protein